MVEHENNIARLTLLESNIWLAEYKVSLIDEDTARAAVAFRLEVLDDDDIRLLADTTNIKSVTKAARDFLGTAAGYEGIEASALVASSPLTVMLGNFYMKFSTQPKPTRLVKNRDEGLAWLRSLKLDE